MKALLFPGQGSQFVGMGKDLYEESEAARRVFDLADATLGFSLSGLMFEGPEETLRETRNAQPAILCHSMAAWKAMDLDLKQSEVVAAGHSLGEYSAYTAAGAFSTEDALRVVRARGELMYEAGVAEPGLMAAIIGLSPDVVTSVCDKTPGIVTAANVNSPGQVVISGQPEAVRAAGTELSEQGAKRVIELNVSGAFHSPLMEPAAKGLREVLEGIEVKRATFPVYANVSANVVIEGSEIKESLIRQLLSPVLWAPTIQTMADLSPTDWFEIGPGQVLRGLVRQTDRSIKCRTLGKADELRAFQEV